jgi:hypothetical protein
VKEYEEMEAQLEDIVSGKAPVFRQGMLAVPQKLVNKIGLIPSALVGVAIVALIGWLVWKLVLAELLGFNDSSPKGAVTSSLGLEAEGSSAAAEEAAYKARQQAQKPKGAAQYRGASPSRNAAGPRPQQQQRDDDDSDSDVDDDGQAFQKVHQHDDVDEDDDDSETEERRKQQSNLRQRKKAPEAAFGGAEEEEEEMSASARAAMKRRQGSRRRVDE